MQVGDGGGGWETEGGLNHQRKSRCVLSKAQKQPQCTCYHFAYMALASDITDGRGLSNEACH